MEASCGSSSTENGLTARQALGNAPWVIFDPPDCPKNGPSQMYINLEVVRVQTRPPSSLAVIAGYTILRAL